MSGTHIHFAVIDFIAFGSRDAVSFLLNNSNTFTEDDYGEYLYVAAKNGHRNVAELLSGRADFIYEDVSDAFYESLEYGHRDVVEWFVSELHLSNEMKGDALGKIAAMGNQELVNRIPSTTTLKPEQRGEAVCAALEERQIDIACTLASSGPIPLSYLKFAMNTCVKNNDYKTLQSILNPTGRLHRQELCKHILKGTDILYRPAMLVGFLMDNIVPQDLIEDCIKKAIFTQNLASVQALLDYRPISDKGAIVALTYAVTLHQHPTIRRLIRSTSFPRRLQQSLLRQALGTNDFIAAAILSRLTEPCENPAKRPRTG